jgi:hypothetical protein
MNSVRRGWTPLLRASILCLVSVIVMSGCAGFGPAQGESKFVNNGITFERYYRVEAPEGEWLKKLNIGPSPDRLIKTRITDDALFLKCPDEQTIQVARVWDEKQGPYLIADAQEERKRVFDDVVTDAMVIMGGRLSTQYVKVDNRDATEFDYLVSGVPRLCSNSAEFDGKMKSRAIVMHGKGSSRFAMGGQFDFLLLIYTSPTDRFDQSLEVFEQMVQSFVFLN